jgi:hypothetical protein
MMVIFQAKVFRVEWDGTPAEPKQRMKVTLKYNEGREHYRYLTPERGERFMAALNAALLELKEGPWMTRGEG